MMKVLSAYYIPNTSAPTHLFLTAESHFRSPEEYSAIATGWASGSRVTFLPYDRYGLISGLVACQDGILFLRKPFFLMSIIVSPDHARDSNLICLTYNNNARNRYTTCYELYWRYRRCIIIVVTLTQRTNYSFIQLPFVWYIINLFWKM